jgi:hypothetical protein
MNIVIIICVCALCFYLIIFEIILPYQVKQKYYQFQKEMKIGDRCRIEEVDTWHTGTIERIGTIFVYVRLDIPIICTYGCINAKNYCKSDIYPIL